MLHLINARLLYEMATALATILAEKNFVSIAIIRWNYTVAAIAGKGLGTPTNAGKEVGPTGRRRCREIKVKKILYLISLRIITNALVNLCKVRGILIMCIVVPRAESPMVKITASGAERDVDYNV